MRHDALRTRFDRPRDGVGWTAVVLAEPPEIPLTVCETRLEPDEITAYCAQLQSTLNPVDGALACAAYFPENGRFFLAVHHLAVDGVSWRILLEDIESSYLGTPAPPETAPFRDWVKTKVP